MQECDEFSILSQTRWAKAKEAGLFDAEMAPVEVPDRKKKVKVIDTDEHPRPESTLEKISQLKPVFKKDGVGKLPGRLNSFVLCSLFANSRLVRDNQ